MVTVKRNIAYHDITSAEGIPTHIHVLKTLKWPGYNKILMGNAGDVSQQELQSYSLHKREAKNI